MNIGQDLAAGRFGGDYNTLNRPSGDKYNLASSANIPLFRHDVVERDFTARPITLVLMSSIVILCPGLQLQRLSEYTLLPNLN